MIQDDLRADEVGRKGAEKWAWLNSMLAFSLGAR